MSTPVTLVTGSRKGIGRYLATHYLERGHIVVGCSRGASDLHHDSYVHHELDISDESAVRRMFGQIRSEYGRLDHLINNAGIASMNHSMLTPIATAERVFDTNFLGTFLMCREGAKLMQKNGRGRIVNFTTVAVPLKLEGEAIYAASKAAVEMLTQVLARELAPLGITVNALGPTPIDTDLIRAVPKDKIEALIGRQAIKRMGHVDDVSNVVDFFLSEASGFVSGQTIYLGGI